MANYRVIIRGAHGRQVYVKNAGSREEAAVKAEAQAGVGIEDMEAVEKTTCDPDYIDSGHKDGHAGPRVLMPAVPWHFCTTCQRPGHQANRCPCRGLIHGRPSSGVAAPII